MAETAANNKNFSLKNRQKYVAGGYDIHTIILKQEQPAQKLRELFYAQNPTVDVCLCYKRENGKEVAHGVQVSERLLDAAKNVLEKKNIPFKVAAKKSP